jgi:hypothetical protein
MIRTETLTTYPVTVVNKPTTLRPWWLVESGETRDCGDCGKRLSEEAVFYCKSCGRDLCPECVDVHQDSREVQCYHCTAANQ